MANKPSLSTRVVHTGMKPAQQGEPLNQGPVFTSAFHLQGDVDSDAYQYARFHNPTWDTLENSLGQLESGRAIVFPSGMAAVAAVLTALSRSGSTILLPSDGYYATRAYAKEFLVKFGVRVIERKTTEILNQDFSNVDLVFVETPSNPLLDVLDITELANRVHQAGGLLAVDNTTMTPLGQQPLELGADVSVCSDTKALNGHSDALFGHAVTRNDSLFEAMKLWRKLSGNIPGPMETWLVQRGLGSLDMRLERMVNNAQEIAGILSRHPRVELIRYPGLPDDPSFALAEKQMRLAGFVISFDLGSKESAVRFLTRSKLITEATSFGGMHTMAERRARWGTDDVPEGLIRLSVGCENVKDLVEDIEQALAF